MKSSISFTILGLLLAAYPVSAQDTIFPPAPEAMPTGFEACDSNVEWPSLPQEVPAVFRPMMVIERGHAEAAFQKPASVPQYAFFVAPGSGICEPVIVVESSAWALGYVSLDGARSNMAAPWHFELLGTEPGVR